MQCELEQTLYAVAAIIVTIAILGFRLNIFQNSLAQENKKKLEIIEDEKPQLEENLVRKTSQLRNQQQIAVEKIEKLEKERLLFVELNDLLKIKTKAQELEVKGNDSTIDFLMRQNLFLQSKLDDLIQENSWDKNAELGDISDNVENFETFHKEYTDRISKSEEKNNNYFLKLQQAETNIEDLEKENGILKTNIEQSKHKISQLEDELSQAREKLNITYTIDKSCISNSREEIAVSKKLEQSEIKIRDLEKENRILKANVEEAKHEISQLKDELAQPADKTNVDYSIDKNYIYNLKKEKNNCSYKLEQAKVRIKDLEVENESLRGNIEKTKREIPQLEAQVTRQARKKELTSLIAEVQNLQKKFDEIQNKEFTFPSVSTKTEEQKERDFSSDEFKSIYGDVAGYIDYIEYVRSHFLDSYDRLE